MRKSAHNEGWIRRGFLALGLSFALCAPMQIARAEPYGPALKTAIELCLTRLNDEERVEAHLIDAGWNKNLSSEVVFDTMTSLNFAFKYTSESAEALEYAFQNSRFMAASILGNSALPANQPSYSLEDINLSPIGLSSDMPYCILSGPLQLDSALNAIGISENNAVGNDPRFSLIEETSRTLYTVRLDDSDVIVSIVDTDAIFEKVAEFSLGQYLETLAVVQEVNVAISPAKPADERL